MLKVFRRAAGGALLMVVLGIGAAAQDATINGEIKKIDEGSGSITLKQGPAPSLGFKDDMTLIYSVRDRAMLKQVKVGDAVKFEAESGDSGFTITRIMKGR
jgi:Cu/Ag efflux protein CusF